MTKAWLGGAMALAIACGPVVSTDTMGDDEESGEEDSTGQDSTSTTADTGIDPTTTSPSTTVGPRLDVGRREIELDGDYLLAVASIVDPSHPLQYSVRVAAHGGLLSLVMQPLTLDVGSTTAPRQPYGEALVYQAIPIDAGCFTLDMGGVMVAGPTNPITGADMVASIVLYGCFEVPNFCGTVDGQVSQPIMLNLAGSTFAAIEATPETLPVEFPLSC